MTRVFIFTALILLFFGCVKDDEINLDELIFECNSSEFEIQDKNSCDSTINYDPFYFCEYRNLGDVFLLQSSRGHLKYMCSLIGKVIFEDSNGQEVSFDISAIATQYATQWSEPCPGDPQRSILFCAANEEATASITNDSLNLEFRVMLIVDSRNGDNSIDDRDRLFITVPKTADFGTYYSLVLSYYIKRGNIYERFNNRYKFQEQVQLNGKIFRNVTSAPMDEPGETEIHYSEEHGIIGFRDREGVLWTFKRFAA